MVFTNETGVSLHGEVLLRSDDVPDTWLRVSLPCDESIGSKQDYTTLWSPDHIMAM